MEETVIRFENVSKKFRKSLRQSMIYGFKDITKNTLGIQSKTDILRQGEFWALDNISFEVKKGETLGIIGPNGAGKTTILKLIAGILLPDKGKVEGKGKVGSLIEIGMSKKEIDEKIDDIIEFADIGDFIDTPVKYYSAGMFVRLGFGVAVHCKPEILLVDEVLAVGDTSFQNKCFNKIGELKKNGTTTILVSHNMHIISAFTEKVIFLYNGKAKYFNNAAEGIKEYTSLFINNKNYDIEKVCSGNNKIKFFDVKINKRIFCPGDSFLISIGYESLLDYKDVDVNTTIYSGNEALCYFEATNKAYNKNINLQKGKHQLKIKIEDIQINNAMAKIVIAIWSKNREELLFWWRIPVEFKGVNYSTGKNFLNVEYLIK